MNIVSVMKTKGPRNLLAHRDLLPTKPHTGCAMLNRSLDLASSSLPP